MPGPGRPASSVVPEGGHEPPDIDVSVAHQAHSSAGRYASWPPGRESGSSWTIAPDFPGAALALRSRAEVTLFFDGLELLEPGVVPVNLWRPGPGGPTRYALSRTGGPSARSRDDRRSAA
jgi:S-adenosyl methyltransferase